MTIEQWLDESTPDRREVPVCFDRGLISRLEAAQQRLAHVVASEPKEKTLAPSEEKAEAEAAVAELEAKVAEKTRILVFEGLGWGPWRDLLAQHPPQADQAKVFNRAVQLLYMPHAIVNLGYNAETFCPAAIAESSSEPKITLEQAKTMIRKAPIGVLERVWTAVLEVNTAGQNDPFVSGGLPASEKK